MAEPPAFAKAWLAQRRAGDAAVAAVEHAELAALTEDEARARIAAVLDSTPIAELAKGRESTSGIVEQQRLFARALSRA